LSGKTATDQLKRDKKSDFEKENWDKNVKGFGAGNSSPFTFI